MTTMTRTASLFEFAQQLEAFKETLDVNTKKLDTAAGDCQDVLSVEDTLSQKYIKQLREAVEEIRKNIKGIEALCEDVEAKRKQAIEIVQTA